MSRDSVSVCSTCKVTQLNGYGSYCTSMDCYLTVEEFDAAAQAGVPGVSLLNKNQNVRAFLVRHAGHDVSFTSGDWWYHDEPDPIKGFKKDSVPPPHPVE